MATGKNIVIFGAAGRTGLATLGQALEEGPTMVMSKGTKNIVTAMKTHSVHKVVACLSAFLLWDLQKVPPQLVPVTEDHILMHRILQDSGLDCIYVMPLPHRQRPAADGGLHGDGGHIRRLPGYFHARPRPFPPALPPHLLLRREKRLRLPGLFQGLGGSLGIDQGGQWPPKIPPNSPPRIPGEIKSSFFPARIRPFSVS
ncbi:uncharacterized protein ACIBXB_006339 isoform 2-T2 [Morphnus guianensis]